jgi:sulfite reductase beta subunit-like hemoprotein
MAARPQSLSLQLNTQDQKMENLQEILKCVGGLCGCPACGRIAHLNIGLLGDPDPTFAKLGVSSFQMLE